MNIFEAVILGIIQGLTEFLPVSSSGHLVLFQQIFGIEEPTITFDIVLHLGTLVAVVAVFWKDILELLKKPFQKYVFLLIVATIPAVIAALFFGDFIDSLFAGGISLAVGFCITGVVMIVADLAKDGTKDDSEITFTDALLIGLAQAVAIAPGISRSGSTITGSLYRKLKRESAAKFSFLMSIPAIVGAAALQIKDIISGDVSISGLNFMNMGAGFIASALSGYLAVKFMLTLIKQAKLKFFSIYVFILAGVVIFLNFR